VKKEAKINILIGVMLGLIIIAFYFSVYEKKGVKQQAGSRQVEPIVDVDVAVVKRGKIEIVRVYTANIEAYKAIDIKTKHAGQLKKIFVEMGDKVKANQLIALMDSNGAMKAYEQKKAALEVIELALQRAKLQREAKKIEYEKMLSLYEKKLISQKEFEKAKAEYKESDIAYELQQAELSQRMAELQEAELILQDTEIRAPFSGFIGNKYIEAGAIVSPNTALATLVAIDKVKVQIDVDEKDLIMLKEGMPTLVYVDSYPNRIFEGVIERMSPVLDSSTHLGKVCIGINNDDNLLKPGMSAKIKMVIKSRLDALIVPLTAVINKDGQDIVYVTNEGKAFERRVKVGVIDESQAELVSGVDEGEWVIMAQQMTLNNGTRVNVRRRY